MIATLVPYRPFLPTRNIAMDLGDKIRAQHTSADPANSTHSDRSDKALKARLIPPPITIAAIPVAPSTRLQKPGDFTEEISMLL